MRLLLTAILFLFINFCNAQSGIFWSPEIDIATSLYSNQHPRIVADRAGNPMVIWGKYNTNEVFFSKMISDSFSIPVTLNPMSIPVFTQSWAGPDIASMGDTVFVVYKQTPEDTNHIYIVSSFDGGLNFSAPVQVDQIADSMSRFPTVAVDDLGNPVVAFMEFDQGWVNARYVVTRSTDMGMTFQPDVLASQYSGGTVCDCCPAALVCSGANTAMLYRDNFNDFRTIWCGLSNDSSQTFNYGLSVDNTSWIINACPSTGPDAIIIGDSVYTVFMSEGNGPTRSYLSSASISQIWAGPTRGLTSDTNTTILNQNFPRISNFGNKVGVVCRQTVDNDGMLALFFTDSIENGLTEQFDTISIGTIANTDIVITENAVHIVWQDDNSETIKYKVGVFDTTNTNPHTSVSLITNDKNNFNIFPNPAKNNFTITGNNISGIKEIELINLEGKTFSVTFEKYNTKVNCLLNDIPVGIYFVALKNFGGLVRYEKLIVE